MACSTSILAVAPLAKKNGDIILTTYAGSTRIRELGRHVIRLNPDATSVAEAIPSLIGEGELPTAVLYEEQDYTTSLSDKLQHDFAKEIAIQVSYHSDAPSVKSELLKIKQSGAKSIVVLPVADQTARTVLREMKDLKLNLPVFGEVNLCDYPFKPSDYGLSGKCLSAQFEGSKYEAFLKEFEKKLGFPPAYPFYDAITFDLFRFLDLLSPQEELSVSKLQSDVLQGFQGQFADYSLTPEGEARGSGKYLKKLTY